jgi:hypothetical protein
MLEEEAGLWDSGIAMGGGRGADEFREGISQNAAIFG